MIDPKIILASHLSRRFETLNPKQTDAAHDAMLDYSVRMIGQYRANEAKAINKEAAGLFVSLIRGNLKLWLRNYYFKRACKQADTLAKITNRKTYVIRSTDISYLLLSTKDIEMNKKMKVLGKHVDAMELTEKSDYIAYPTRGDLAKSVYVRKKLK